MKTKKYTIWYLPQYWWFYQNWEEFYIKIGTKTTLKTFCWFNLLCKQLAMKRVVIIKLFRASRQVSRPQAVASVREKLILSAKMWYLMRLINFQVLLGQTSIRGIWRPGRFSSLLFGCSWAVFMLWQHSGSSGMSDSRVSQQKIPL